MSQIQLPSPPDSRHDYTSSPIDEAPPLTYLKGTTSKSQVHYTPSQQGPISREAPLPRQKFSETQPLPAQQAQQQAGSYRGFDQARLSSRTGISGTERIHQIQQQLPAVYYRTFDDGPPPQVRGPKIAGLQQMQYGNYQRDPARSAEARQRDAQMHVKLGSASLSMDASLSPLYLADSVGDGLYTEDDSGVTITESNERGDIPGSVHWTTPLYPNQWPVVPGSNPSVAVHEGGVTDADRPSVKSQSSNKAREPNFLADRFFPMISS